MQQFLISIEVMFQSKKQTIYVFIWVYFGINLLQAQ